METKDLEFALKLAQPCLLGVDFIPVLSHYCFDEGLVYAYDGVSATVVTCETDLKCAVRGDMLVGIVNLAGPTLSLKQSKDKITVSSGRSNVELPCLQPSDFMFQFPEEDEKTTFRLTKTILKGIALCASGVSKDPRKIEFTGVTMQLGEGAIFYSSDNLSITKFETKEKVGKKQLTVLVPKSVCDQISTVVSALEAEIEKVTVSITKDFIIVQFEETTPGVTIIGKLLTAQPAQFEKIIESCKTNHPKFPIPEAFGKAVAKVALVISKEVQKDCVITTNGEEFTVSGKGGLGQAETKFDTGHIRLPEITTVCSPEHLTQVLGDATHLIVDEKAIQMRGDNLTYYVATRT